MVLKVCAVVVYVVTINIAMVLPGFEVLCYIYLVEVLHQCSCYVISAHCHIAVVNTYLFVCRLLTQRYCKNSN